MEADSKHNLSEGLKGYINHGRALVIGMLDETAGEKKIACDYRDGKKMTGFCLVCLEAAGITIDFTVSNTNRYTHSLTYSIIYTLRR